MNLIGNIYGRLTVIERDKTRKDRVFWICSCECGNSSSVYQNHLKTGATRSCGYLRREQFLKRLTKHGMCGTKIYRVYKGMLERCYYKKHKAYKNYGGRGIFVCKEWRNKVNGFKNFYAWLIKNNYEEGLTLDRIDNNKGYSPKNCRWVTTKEQARNKRNSVRIEIEGEVGNLEYWSEKLNIKFETLKDRYYNGRFP